MDCDVQTLISGDHANALVALNNFLAKSSKSFSFPELNQNNYRKNLWQSLGQILINKKQHDLHLNTLSAIRILSRDKTGLNELVTTKLLDSIVNHANLSKDANQFAEPNYELNVEALKCLSNIIYNSEVAVAMSCKNATIEAIIMRLRTYRDSMLPTEIKFFHMRILFLITALCSEVRSKIKKDLHGSTYLIETLDLILKESNKELSEDQVNLACEILKVLFNLSATMHESYMDEKEVACHMRLVIILHDYLVFDVCNPAKKLELHNHIINLMTCMPMNSFKGLRTPILDGEIVAKELQYEEQNMTALHEILSYLKCKLDEADTFSKQRDTLPPVLAVLLKAAQVDRFMRKYLRIHILPPLKDVINRPEQGNSLRNHLCRLLTCPIKQIHQVVAELLFVICKENVNRMVKYTGYGNAAGLLAGRGLLGLGETDTSEYSSDSGDSDTEEYKQLKHCINPVMGCYEPPHPNPIANMTEEQKEYEAMKLVEMMDNLTRTGVVKPCRIGQDGRPEPIAHVLQLQEGLQKQQVRMEDDSD
ncbi:PREDICTED: synembryn-A [Nicrophorus vespilloides]|uniref:Synembryn-A n=1 Tax=Nicrophorus vespilloides TaxID=110193 RepID=A0ABM1MF64_NICVS|nr:PREDICTED: synembryn-A [Nicrophorus vespilloides]